MFSSKILLDLAPSVFASTLCSNLPPHSMIMPLPCINPTMLRPNFTYHLHTWCVMIYVCKITKSVNVKQLQIILQRMLLMVHSPSFNSEKSCTKLTTFSPGEEFSPQWKDKKWEQEESRPKGWKINTGGALWAPNTDLIAGKWIKLKI